MKKLTTNQIRQIWLDFFANKQHYIEEQKSLIPVNDDSLLFINSGVATLKAYFDGSKNPLQSRLANAQKSLRTNDIENVGLTARHHTLFEMLGNFSIGDYFKSEAIEYAIELLCSDKYYGLSKNRLYITVHPDDKESYNKWVEVGINVKKIVKFKENFWEIGKGPGGPNTEIFYDRGKKYDARDPKILLSEDLENDRLIEIWNIVFSQYNCDPENLAQNEYPELPQKNIDTGMGLERMACVLQKVETNFETDNFMKIIEELQTQTGLDYQNQKVAFRVISDHIRALVFSIADGIIPSNEGRGYVVRRILRRAVKYATRDFKIDYPFLHKLVDVVVISMKKYYPYLIKNSDFIKQVIQAEELKFLKTLQEGNNLLDEALFNLKGKILAGDVAFKLYDTYGFPVELTIELAQVHDIKVDIKVFDQLMIKQRVQARKANKNKLAISEQNIVFKDLDLNFKFIGYHELHAQSEVVFITDLKQSLASIKDKTGYVIIDKCPFYGQSGGQSGDSGWLDNFKVINTTKVFNDYHLLEVEVNGKLSLNQIVDAQVDGNRRQRITKNHSATHLLHLALHKYVGEHALQSGSAQDAHKTRFDFSNLNPLTTKQIDDIELYVNHQIILDFDVKTRKMSLNNAKELGAKALFGEKYGEEVRVIVMGDSIELCGGTHVEHTKQIRLFHIINESGIGSGIRRIEAITGDLVSEYGEQLVEEIKQEIKKLTVKIKQEEMVNLHNLKQLEMKFIRLRRVYDNQYKLIAKKINDIKIDSKKLEIKLTTAAHESQKEILQKVIQQKKNKYNANFVDCKIENLDPKNLKILADQVIANFISGVVIIRLVNEQKVQIVVKVSDDLIDKVQAEKLLKEIIIPLGGHGGGKPSIAQGSYIINN